MGRVTHTTFAENFCNRKFVFRDCVGALHVRIKMKLKFATEFGTKLMETLALYL
jgi:hypothetical protein